jgi:hypothetical protein
MSRAEATTYTVVSSPARWILALGDIVLEVRKPDRQQAHVVAVRRNDGVVFIDRVDLADAKSRSDFVKRVGRARGPVIPEKALLALEDDPEHAFAPVAAASASRCGRRPGPN